MSRRGYGLRCWCKQVVKVEDTPGVGGGGRPPGRRLVVRCIVVGNEFSARKYKPCPACPTSTEINILLALYRVAIIHQPTRSIQHAHGQHFGTTSSRESRCRVKIVGHLEWQNLCEVCCSAGLLAVVRGRNVHRGGCLLCVPKRRVRVWRMVAVRRHVGGRCRG